MNQQILRGGQRFSKKRAESVFRCVEQIIGKHSYQISIAFVSPSQMRQANHLYRGQDHVTDVLSFQLTSHEGELLLSYAQAKKQARLMRHSISDELTFLIVHGTLHLFGHDHETPGDAKKMYLLQEKILKTLGVDPIL